MLAYALTCEGKTYIVMCTQRLNRFNENYQYLEHERIWTYYSHLNTPSSCSFSWYPLSNLIGTISYDNLHVLTRAVTHGRKDIWRRTKGLWSFKTYTYTLLCLHYGSFSGMYKSPLLTWPCETVPPLGVHTRVPNRGQGPDCTLSIPLITP